MEMISYSSLFAEQASHETRVLTIQGHPQLPDDAYGLIEYYCTDPKCDCQMVMLQVHPATAPNRNLASICYIFDPTEKILTEPMLDLVPIPSPFATILLELVKPLLADPLYAARLQAHYYQVKQRKGLPRLRLGPKSNQSGLEQFSRRNTRKRR